VRRVIDVNELSSQVVLFGLDGRDGPSYANPELSTHRIGLPLDDDSLKNDAACVTLGGALGAGRDRPDSRDDVVSLSRSDCHLSMMGRNVAPPSFDASTAPFAAA
jgi:hypothetical protein